MENFNGLPFPPQTNRLTPKSMEEFGELGDRQQCRSHSFSCNFQPHWCMEMESFLPAIYFHNWFLSIRSSLPGPAWLWADCGFRILTQVGCQPLIHQGALPGLCWEKQACQKGISETAYAPLQAGLKRISLIRRLSLIARIMPAVERKANRRWVWRNTFPRLPSQTGGENWPLVQLCLWFHIMTKSCEDNWCYDHLCWQLYSSTF